MKERVRAIIKESKSILLIHRMKKGKEYWVFPGGGVEKIDVDHELALIRECDEELGVGVNVGRLFTTYKFGEGDKG